MLVGQGPLQDCRRMYLGGARPPVQALAIAHGGTGELAQLLAEIDGMSRGLPEPIEGKLLPDCSPDEQPVGGGFNRRIQ
jgi:hypothetical protein